MFDLYVDGVWKCTDQIEGVFSVAKQFLQFGCNIEIRQADDLPSVQPFMYERFVSTTFPAESIIN